MSENNKLQAVVRENFGKGAARKLRAVGQTPAVIYGHGTDPKHIAVETHPLSLIIRHANALIELDLDGKKELVLVKDVQKDPVRQIIEHVDLIIIKKGETVEVEVPIVIVGEPFSGTNALQELNTLRLSVPATNIPEHIEVSVEGLEAGTHILAGDLKLASDETLLDTPDHLVVQVVLPRGADEAEEGEEAAEAAEPAAE
ncbi:50S ribosomal protein L25/general stress protein Ctc [Leucobacter denitrificans]|uniref:Large ribosomal subunit protein bL25 n=1 Tax=Leucobacter denitrificans TaxID=683042 RepID=A0A7G9S4J8_9MICO|nr:50S ribosomal protein L25/general stress protein Ctc [Leucobacter denitrificans]QNN62773.1 50S ribosomal protein L25/general stress protein Ctc [Leucobacter denitrificans]